MNEGSDQTSTLLREQGIHVHVHPYDGADWDYRGRPDGGDLFIGRSGSSGAQQAQILLDDKYASRRHCRLFWDAREGWRIEDLASANGTKLNGEPLTETLSVVSGDRLRIGTTELTLLLGEVPEVAGGGEATLALSADADATATLKALGEYGDDATAMLPTTETEEDATAMLPTREAMEAEVLDLGAPLDAEVGEATAFLGGMEPSPEATLLTTAESSEEATILGSTTAPTEEATLLRAPPAEDEEEATILRRQDTEEATRLPEADATRTLLHPDRDAATLAGPDALPAGTVDDHDATAAGTLLDQDAGERRGGSDQAGPTLPPLAAELIRHNLLEPRKAAGLMEIARANGTTFFRSLGEDRSVRFMSEIFEYVAQREGLELIADEKRLMERAIETAWLDFDKAHHQGLLALAGGSDGQVLYGTIDPYDLPLRDWVRRHAGRSARPLLLLPDAFFPAVRRLRSRSEEEEEQELGVAIDISPQKERQIRDHLDHVAIPQMVNYFLHRAHVAGASDIHIEPGEELLVVRNRVDGILHEEVAMPMAFHQEVVSRIKIMSGMDVAEKRRPQDGRFGVQIQSNPIDVRVSSYPTVYGEKIVFRLLDKNALRPSPETLGLMARDLRLLKDKIQAPYGLIMISGPTGSGKTTTLYSCLSAIDRKSKNILTVEDPVEYRLAGVYQMQVNEKIGLTFASGLRTILRQDPDVVMVGECRDQETAAMAIQASLTGHIVFSTIHTNDAVGVITRLLDMEIEPFLVSTALSMAIAQRLVRTICPHCKATMSGTEILAGLTRDGVSAERLEQLGIDIDPDLDYAQGAGCQHCRNTGYLRRRAVFEVFEMTNEARNLVMSADFNADKLRELARETGMTTLISHGLKLVEEEVTTFEEVIRVLGEGS